MLLFHGWFQNWTRSANYKYTNETQKGIINWRNLLAHRFILRDPVFKLLGSLKINKDSSFLFLKTIPFTTRDHTHTHTHTENNNNFINTLKTHTSQHILQTKRVREEKTQARRFKTRTCSPPS